MATSERITITLPAGMVSDIDKLESNRSRFVTEAVRREFRRRRRNDLQRSLEAPHAESTPLADVGLAEWAAGMPDDEDLVDPAAGKRVKWVRGKGWIKGRA